jgi:histidinol dehydrogenase
MMSVRLRRLNARDAARMRGFACDDETRREVETIIDDVQRRGDAAVREWSERFRERTEDQPIVLDRSTLEHASGSIDADVAGLLSRTADRIRRFADRQREMFVDISCPIPGGACGHRVWPMDAAGCYAPGGRYPLPSSVLMTLVTARAAGVRRVVAASPRPNPITLAAASIADADAMLTVGGAHAIAALAYGTESIERADVIVGPGNRWVTAAKQVVASRGVVGVDMQAGPSELVVVADGSARPDVVAADLLAQAEHDDDAVVGLIAVGEGVIDEVERALAEQMVGLSTAPTARRSIEKNGFAMVAVDLEDSIEIVNVLAPEHVHLCTVDADWMSQRVRHAGATFVGQSSAEVLGDYGAGPNHTLPTGGAARFASGLSVAHFLRLQTCIAIEDAEAARELAADAAALARLEGLEAHARAADRRALHS